MKILDVIINFFKRNKTKKLGESVDTQKIFLQIKQEKDSKKVEEMISNYADVLSSSEIIQLIGKLPLKDRVRNLISLHEHIISYDISSFATARLDSTRKIEILEYFAKDLDIYDIYAIINSIAPDRRLEALDKIAGRLDPYSLTELIESYIPAVDKKEALYKYENDLDMFSKASIIKQLPFEDKLEATEKYANKFSENLILEIVNTVSEKETLKILREIYTNLSSETISEIVCYNVPETERMQALVETQGNLTSGIIADIIKYYLTKEDRKQALITLKDKLDERHILEILQDTTIADKELIDKLKNNMDEEDVAYLKNINVTA